MENSLLIKLRDYASIVFLLFRHMRQKWRLETTGLIVVVVSIILSLILSNIASMINGVKLELIVVITYTSIIVCGLAILINNRSNLTLSKLTYEGKYFFRLFKFMVECYNNIIIQYKAFLRVHHLLGRNLKQVNRDMIIVGTIFKKIFRMYFDSLYAKHKDSYPYLIDVQEMKTLYNSKEFNDFYSALFFKVHKGHSPYEQVVLNIFDEVMTTLYQKPWFTEYYDRHTLFQMIKYILVNWFDNVVQYSVSDKSNEVVA